MSKIKVLVLCCVIGFLFTVLVYTLEFEFRIYRYVLISVFYCLFITILAATTDQKRSYLLFSTTVTPILIDASVIITYPEIIPLRFPFASIFPILGALIGLLIITKKYKAVFVSTIAFIFFSIFSHKVIIPNISYGILNRNSPEIRATIFSESFYSLANTKVMLKDTGLTKCILIECFFVGCLPCEQKVAVFKQLQNQLPDSLFSIIMICDGRYTKFEEFIAYSKKKNDPRLIFLYDRDSILFNKYQLTKYPFEILANKRHQIVLTRLGYDASFSDLYYNKQIKAIKQILNESDH